MLSEELGISPTPIREAFARLVSERALVPGDRRSVRVPELDAERFLEIRELRLALEGIAAERAAARATEAEIDALEAVHAAVLQAVGIAASPGSCDTTSAST